MNLIRDVYLEYNKVKFSFAEYINTLGLEKIQHMTRFGHLALIILSLTILSYGFPGSIFAQDTGCPPDYVMQLNECVFAFDEEPGSSPFTIETDKASYDDGNTVHISGMIKTLNENFPQAVTLMILDPNKKIVSIAQIIPDPSGAFSTSIVASSDGTMTASGEYEVRAQYGAQKTSTTFSFTSLGFTPPPECASDEVLVNGQCVLKQPEPPQCASGEVLVNGQCVLKEPEPPQCASGEVLVNGQCILKEPEPQCGPGTHEENGLCVPDTTGGGCLIATATYGSELAPQVQFLREVRDNTVLSTSSGSVFMTSFNEFYYSFSPTIADWERQNPAFKEAVKLFITPMISSLSIMTLADSGSEAEVLAFGISVIALNIGLYIVAPTAFAYKMHRHYRSRN
ncbi:MAG: Ig family protein [Nitrosopumilales archaeon]|nr:MAG: Ig family protein [Nitrosopumilales archaeon]